VYRTARRIRPIDGGRAATEKERVGGGERRLDETRRDEADSTSKLILCVAFGLSIVGDQG
jgi:hypothetical protein